MFRSPVHAALAACAFGVLSAVGAHALAGQQPVFRGTGDIVRVYATVTDHDGRLATNLPRDAFEVRDDGKPQPITQFDSTPQPIRLIVMLDVSGSMHGNLPLLRGASQQLFLRLRNDDVARLGTFGIDINISPAFTRNLRELEGALPQSIPEDAPTPLWRALDEAMTAFGDEREPRAVILVMTDGKDTGSGMPGSFKHAFVSQAQVIDRSRTDAVMIYGVGMRSRAARPQQPGMGMGGLRAAMLADLPDPGLAKVAEESGGGYTEIRYGEDLGAAFAQVADELHSQYLLGYVPPKRDGKEHKIEVRINQKGFSTRARRSYVAPKE